MLAREMLMRSIDVCHPDNRSFVAASKIKNDAEKKSVKTGEVLTFKREVSSSAQKDFSRIAEEEITKKQEPQPQKEVKVFFTKDKEILDQYYALRHYAYHDENGWNNYNGSENKYDRSGHILVAMRDGKVIGGTRIMFSNECEYLSNEIPGTDFNYNDIVRKYDKRENIIFSEISAVVVADGERDRSVSMRMFEENLKESQRRGCHYICGVGVAVVCRDYRRIFRELGYYLEIVMTRPWQVKETYGFAKMFPMHVKIS